MSFDLALEGYDQQRGRQFQLNVLRQVESRPVLWLCSDAASYVTGLSLILDGGVISAFR